MKEEEQLKQIKEEIDAIKKKNTELDNDIEALRQKNKDLEDENSKLKDENKNLKKSVDNKEMKMSKSHQLHKETVKKLSEVKEVNAMLIEDVRILNDRLLVFVPGAVEKENSELKETLAMLHTVIDIY